LLFLNLFWGMVELSLLVALARGALPRKGIALALGASCLAFFLESGFGASRFHTMCAASFAIFLHVPITLLAIGGLQRRSPRRAHPCLL
jgi:hypothetical protein